MEFSPLSPNFQTTVGSFHTENLKHSTSIIKQACSGDSEFIETYFSEIQPVYWKMLGGRGGNTSKILELLEKIHEITYHGPLLGNIARWEEIKKLRGIIEPSMEIINNLKADLEGLRKKSQNLQKSVETMKSKGIQPKDKMLRGLSDTSEKIQKRIEEIESVVVDVEIVEKIESLLKENRDMEKTTGYTELKSNLKKLKIQEGKKNGKNTSSNGEKFEYRAIDFVLNSHILSKLEGCIGNNDDLHLELITNVNFDIIEFDAVIAIVHGKTKRIKEILKIFEFKNRVADVPFSCVAKLNAINQFTRAKKYTKGDIEAKTKIGKHSYKANLATLFSDFPISEKLIFITSSSHDAVNEGFNLPYYLMKEISFDILSRDRSTEESRKIAFERVQKKYFNSWVKSINLITDESQGFDRCPLFFI